MMATSEGDGDTMKGVENRGGGMGEEDTIEYFTRVG